MDAPMNYVAGATVLVGPGLEPVVDAVIGLRNDTITAVGPRAQMEVPVGAEIHDASGSTIVPGFIDAHVHIGFYAPRDVLIRGVTSVRDLAWPPEIIFPLARRSATATFTGPQIFPAGPMLTAPGGYPTRAEWAPDGTGAEISSDGDVLEVVRHLSHKKATIIKVALNPDAGPVLDAPILRTIVEEAHVAGLKVTAHASGLAELEKALDCGVDELAHMLMGTDVIPEALMQGMVERRMAVVPTLAIRSGRERRVAVANLERFFQAGGLVVYGTDLGNTGVRPGIDPKEVMLMAKAGMGAAEIVRSATVDSADWLGLKDRGVIAPGKRADLVALDRVDSPGDLTRVGNVWRAGILTS
jgi:imidazolonepropionase-like amidohydrolase